MSTKVRPSGITVLVVLEILAGLGLLLGGAMFAVLASFSGGFGGMMGGVLGALSGAIGVIFVVMGIITFFIAYGLWTGKGWARMFGLVIAGIGIILGILSLPSGIISIIIDGIIIYYLTRPHVVQFFSTP